MKQWKGNVATAASCTCPVLQSGDRRLNLNPLSGEEAPGSADAPEEASTLGMRRRLTCCSVMGEWTLHTCWSRWSCLGAWDGSEADPGGLMSTAGGSTVSGVDGIEYMFIFICCVMKKQPCGSVLLWLASVFLIV